ncbi:MAG: hypothetical protein MZV49_04430 [Rhodopseudomonas palustris]|nr:hypothetical protein [Rhodopseudomonas palustris]
MQGSVEAIVQAAGEARHRRGPRARRCMPASAAITESDVALAEASQRADHRLQRPRQQAGARRGRARTASRSATTTIIYDLVDDVKKAMSGLLAPTLRETFLGYARDPGGLQRSPRSARSPAAASPKACVERGARCPPAPRQRGDPRRQAVDAEALQGRGQGSRSPARNAAWPSRTTRTSAPATSSSAIRRRDDPAHCCGSDSAAEHVSTSSPSSPGRDPRARVCSVCRRALETCGTDQMIAEPRSITCRRWERCAFRLVPCSEHIEDG